MYIIMEGIKEEAMPKIDLVDNSQKMSRREFLEKTTLGLTAVGVALAFGGCSPKDTLGAESEKDNLKKNIEELNKQYIKLNKEPFSYERYVKEYPEFEQYIPFIDTVSDYAAKSDGINTDAMKTIISSIIAANINYKEEKDSNKDPNYKRTGPMQFYPINSQKALKERLNDNTKYTQDKLEDPFFNIIVGKECILYTLQKIKNDGKNNNIFALTLAGYYDYTNKLTDIVKNNLDINNFSNLKQDYELYKKTLNILERKENKNKESKEILNKAIQYWPDTNIKLFKDVFINEADKYYNDEYNINLKLSKAELTAIFVSVAMTESNGGIFKESPSSGAVGWYQLVPQWEHLENYNNTHNTNYTYEDLYNDDKISIEVGVWTLMRYRNSMNILESLKFFKGGHTFGQNLDDGIWWNRVSYCTQKLLGKDTLNMGYLDYFYNGTPVDKDYFLKNPEHIGNVLVSESN